MKMKFERLYEQVIFEKTMSLMEQDPNEVQKEKITNEIKSKTMEDAKKRAALSIEGFKKRLACSQITRKLYEFLKKNDVKLEYAKGGYKPGHNYDLDMGKADEKSKEEIQKVVKEYREAYKKTSEEADKFRDAADDLRVESRKKVMRLKDKFNIHAVNHDEIMDNTLYDSSDFKSIVMGDLRKYEDEYTSSSKADKDKHMVYGFVVDYRG